MSKLSLINFSIESLNKFIKANQATDLESGCLFFKKLFQEGYASFFFLKLEEEQDFRYKNYFSDSFMCVNGFCDHVANISSKIESTSSPTPSILYLSTIFPYINLSNSIDSFRYSLPKSLIESQITTKNPSDLSIIVSSIILLFLLPYPSRINISNIPGQYDFIWERISETKSQLPNEFEQFYLFPRGLTNLQKISKFIK